MTFYSADYLSQQGNVTSTLGIVMLLITFVLMAVGLVATMRHRLNTRYRDLTIIALLSFLFFAGIQYTDYQTMVTKNSQQSQMGTFATQFAENQNVSSKKVYFNSTTLTDGMLVKEGKKYYSITLSKDQKAYSLTRVYLFNEKVEVVQ